jgi:hypothetical protein
MPQPSCESLVEAVQKCTQDLSAIDEQLHGLEGEGMNQLHPWRYLALQPQVDRLITKKHALQDAWNRAMTGLAICRLGQSSSHQP